MDRRRELAVAVMGASIVGIAIAIRGEVGAVVILALIAFAAAVARPAAMLPVALVLGLLQFGPTRAYPILPVGASFIDDVIVLGLFCRWLIEAIRYGPSVDRGMIAPLALLAAIGVVSALVHAQSIDRMLLAFRGLLLPATLYLVSARYAEDPRLRRRLIRWVVALAALHAVAAIGQWLSSPGKIDSAFGLLGAGGANALGLLALIAACLIVASERMSAARWVLIAALCAGMVASSARAAMIATFPALVVAMRNRLVRVRSFVLVGLLAAVTILSVSHYYRVSGRDIREDLAPSYLLHAQYVPEQGGRMLYLAAVPGMLQASRWGWVLGVGPGGFTSYVGVNARSKTLLAVAPPSTLSESGLGNADSEWVAVLGEYGIVGLGCILVLMIRPAVVALRRQRAGDLDIMTGAMPAIVVTGLLGATAMNFLEYQPLAYAFWILAGVTETKRTADDEEGLWKAS